MAAGRQGFSLQYDGYDFADLVGYFDADGCRLSDSDVNIGGNKKWVRIYLSFEGFSGWYIARCQADGGTARPVAYFSGGGHCFEWQKLAAPQDRID